MRWGTVVWYGVSHCGVMLDSDQNLPHVHTGLSLLLVIVNSCYRGLVVVRITSAPMSAIKRPPHTSRW